MAHGRYSTEGWVTTVALEEAERALRELRAGKGMKILVQA
jgi:(R,R)-butanediol dehydrogenase/meso-butanediol dehydrogenase/diacetyl reductase